MPKTKLIIVTILTLLVIGGITGEKPSTAKAQAVPGLVSIVVNPSDSSVAAGSTQQFMAVLLDANGMFIPGTVSWTSSDPAVGTIDPVTGLFTAIGVGTTTITAQNGTITGTTSITTTDGPPVIPGLASIKINPSSSFLGVGQTKQFSAILLDANGMMIPGTVSWTSSDSNIGTISSGGLFNALSVGTATITATNGTITGSASVTVTQNIPVLTTINVTPANPDVVTGEFQQFSAETLDQYGNPFFGMTTWTSSNPVIGTVDFFSGKFTAKTVGTATITASSGGISGTATVNVIPLVQILTSLNTAPFDMAIWSGGSQPCSAAPLDQKGNLFIGANITWSSDNTAVATVTADPTPASGTNATVLGVGAGITTIRVTVTDPASGTSLSGSIPITVVSMDNFPTITVLGNNPETVNVGTAYSDAGATASDVVYGDLTANIVTTGLPIDTTAPGTYTVTYSITNVVGNTTTATRTVNVAAAPVVCQTGADTNSDGLISNLEILNYISGWKSGTVSNLQILQAIQFWKAGTGC